MFGWRTRWRRVAPSVCEGRGAGLLGEGVPVAFMQPKTHTIARPLLVRLWFTNNSNIAPQETRQDGARKGTRPHTGMRVTARFGCRRQAMHRRGPSHRSARRPSTKLQTLAPHHVMCSPSACVGEEGRSHGGSWPHRKLSGARLHAIDARCLRPEACHQSTRPPQHPHGGCTSNASPLLRFVEAGCPWQRLYDAAFALTVCSHQEKKLTLPAAHLERSNAYPATSPHVDSAWCR